MLFMAEDVPSFGSKKYFLSKKDYTSTVTMASTNVLENDLIRVQISPETGDIISLKIGDVEFVKQDAVCALNSYRYLIGEDEPEKAFRSENVQIRIKEDGPVFASIEVLADGEGCRSLLNEISITDRSPVVHIKNTIDKIAINQKEGVHFGFAFNIENPKIGVDLPWGLMEIEEDQLSGANRNWIALQRWVEISNEKQGITWCPIDAPIFEVGTMTANILGGATNSDKWIRKLDPVGTIYSWALNNHWHTNFPLSQEGRLIFRYHLKPHLRSYTYGDANHFSMEQVHPLLVVSVHDDYKTGQLLSLDASESISVSVFKTLEDGQTSVLRLRSHSDEDKTVKLLWNELEPSSVSILDLSNNQVVEEIKNEVIVPSRDFVNLKVVWK
jgi:alpha-mannosidase